MNIGMFTPRKFKQKMSITIFNPELQTKDDHKNVQPKKL
jgi:hypothetical protein